MRPELPSAAPCQFKLPFIALKKDLLVEQLIGEFSHLLRQMDIMALKADVSVFSRDFLNLLQQLCVVLVVVF